MSRLEDLTHRFLTQRAALDRAVEIIADVDGIIVELGLGKGRTFDHLREHLPNREIFVFDHELSCERDFAPPSEFCVFGDITSTLPAFCKARRGQVALVHSDIGTSDRTKDIPLVEFVAGQLALIMKDGGVVASDRPMPGNGWRALPELQEMQRFPYYMYRKQIFRFRVGKAVI